MRSVASCATALRLCAGLRTASLLCTAWLLSSVDHVAAKEPAPREHPRFLYLAGSDLWRHGSFSYGGMLWSPGGLDRSGFTFKILIGGGDYRYRSGALADSEVSGQQWALFALPGWRFQVGSVTATIFAGLDVQRHRLSPDDPSGGLRGTMSGFRTGIEIWTQPAANTMIAADAFFSTVGPGYSARMSFGWMIGERFYVGPEVQGFAGDDSYNQFRTGLHITGLKAGDFEWSAAAGWARDSDDRDGLYGRLGVLWRD